MDTQAPQSKVLLVGIELPGTTAIEPPIADTIVSVTDADEEVRAVVRRIADLRHLDDVFSHGGCAHEAAQ